MNDGRDNLEPDFDIGQDGGLACAAVMAHTVKLYEDVRSEQAKRRDNLAAKLEVMVRDLRMLQQFSTIDALTYKDWLALKNVEETLANVAKRVKGDA